MKHNGGLLRQVIISVGVLVVLGVLGVVLLRQPRSEAQSAPAVSSSEVSVSDSGRHLVDLKTAVVQARALDNDLHTTGLVSYPADQTVKISPRVAGRIRTVLVRVGDAVAAGQTLAILESPDAAAAQTTFVQDENKLRLARSNLDRQERLFRLGTPEVTQAQANLDQARANTRYNRDALAKIKEQAGIGGFTEKPIEDAENASVAAESALAQAQSDLALAQRDHDRKVKLLEIGVVAKTDVEASQNVLEKAQVSVAADQRQVDLAHQAVARDGAYRREQL
jgi:multidrug resistance efflux pump